MQRDKFFDLSKFTFNNSNTYGKDDRRGNDLSGTLYVGATPQRKTTAKRQQKLQQQQLQLQQQQPSEMRHVMRNIPASYRPRITGGLLSNTACGGGCLAYSRPQAQPLQLAACLAQPKRRMHGSIDSQVSLRWILRPRTLRYDSEECATSSQPGAGSATAAKPARHRTPMRAAPPNDVTPQPKEYSIQHLQQQMAQMRAKASLSQFMCTLARQSAEVDTAAAAQSRRTQAGRQAAVGQWHDTSQRQMLDEQLRLVQPKGKPQASNDSLLQVDVVDTSSTCNSEAVPAPAAVLRRAAATLAASAAAAAAIKNATSTAAGDASNSSSSNTNNEVFHTPSSSDSSNSTTQWSNGQEQGKPPNAGTSKSLKLTSTVIKLLPSISATTLSADAAPSVVTVLPATGKPTPAANMERQPTRRPKPIKRPQQAPLPPPPPPTPTALPAPKQQQQSLRMPPPASPQAVRVQPELATATQHYMQTLTSKIVQKAQHKVPSSIEDGIDTSYQTFVSKPLKRGKKPQVIRYLYRPMVRSLNKSPPGHQQRRRTRRTLGEAQQSRQRRQQRQHSTDNDIDDLVESSDSTALLPALADKLSGSQLPQRKRSYTAPRLKVDAKYMPYMQQLSKMPYIDKPAPPPPVAVAAPAAAPAPPAIAEPASGTMHTSCRRLAPTLSLHLSNRQQLQCALRNYQPYATRLQSAAGANISYHTPIRLDVPVAVAPSSPMATPTPTPTTPPMQLAEQPMSPPKNRMVAFQLSNGQRCVAGDAAGSSGDATVKGRTPAKRKKCKVATRNNTKSSSNNKLRAIAGGKKKHTK